jgi:hypothetical protein
MSFVAQTFHQRRVLNRRGELTEDVVGELPVFGALLWEKLFVPSERQLAGLPLETGHHGPGPAAARPLPTEWLSDERIADTRRVWSRAYGRVITDDEAVEILMNVRRLAEILMRAEEENQKP